MNFLFSAPCGRIAGALLTAALTLTAPSAQAQNDYPSKPITLVIAYPPGGGADAIGRLVAQKLGDQLGTNFIIDNRPGFSGNIGAAHAAKSTPDGYTLLVAPWTTYAINSVLFPGKVGYELDKDFAPISLIGFQPMVLLVPATLPVNSVSDLIALAKSKPGSLSYGSTGPGSLEHISSEMFKRQTGTSMVHVPYRGSGPAVVDLMSGQIQVLIATAPTYVGNAQGGRVKPLMVTTLKRNPAFPDLPTPEEAGVLRFEVRSTYGLLAPAGTPPAIVKRLNEGMAKVLQTQEVKDRFRSLGMDATWSTPEELSRLIRLDLATWAQVIKEENIKTE